MPTFHTIILNKFTGLERKSQYCFGSVFLFLFQVCLSSVTSKIGNSMLVFLVNDNQTFTNVPKQAEVFGILPSNVDPVTAY